METAFQINVATLDAPHRRALEEVIGRQLAGDQRLMINVIDVQAPSVPDQRPAQTLDDWTNIYDGLTDEEIEDIDTIVKTRANLTRYLP